MGKIILNDDQIQYVCAMIRSEVRGQPHFELLIDEIENILIGKQNCCPDKAKHNTNETDVVEKALEVVRDHLSDHEGIDQAIDNLLYTRTQKTGLRVRLRKAETVFDRTVA